MHQKRAAGELHSLPVHVMKGVKEERGVRWRTRLCNTFAREVDSAEQNGDS